MLRLRAGEMFLGPSLDIFVLQPSRSFEKFKMSVLLRPTSAAIAPCERLSLLTQQREKTFLPLPSDHDTVDT